MEVAARKIPEEQKIKPYKATRKPDALTAAAASSSKPTDKQFVAVLRGEYWTKPMPNNPAQLQSYQAAFLLNSAQSRVAISYIRAYLLSNKLREKHADFHRVYTHHLVALHQKSDPSAYVGIPYHWMGLGQIERIISDLGIPIDVSIIADLHELRALVRVWCENPVDKTAFQTAVARAQTNLTRSLKGLDDENLAPEEQDTSSFDEEAVLQAAGIGRIKLDASLTL